MNERPEFIRDDGAERRALPGRLLLLGTALAIGLALLPACRNARSVQGTSIWSGDTLQGRLAEGSQSQAFVFEGVESSILDFTLQADEGNVAAPNVRILDPEGVPLDVDAGRRTSPGSATVRVEGLVLSKTGTYKVIATPAQPGQAVFYRFRHEIRFPRRPDSKAHLTAETPRPVYVSAPRGGLIAFSIKPEAGSGLVPDIHGVTDPWGGPALDHTQVPKGALPPRVSHAHDGTMILTFVAPRPGMYTILAAAKPGAEGVGTLHVEVRRPRWPARTVYHGSAPATGFGLPAPPPAPPPPPATASPPGSNMPPTPPVDPPIAVR